MSTSALAPDRFLLPRALAVLALIVLVEVLNGTVRQLVVTPLVGDFTGRQIATGTGALLILVTVWATAPWLAARTPRQQWAVGALWLAGMLAFEVGVGRWVVGASWARIAADYNLTQGGLLGLGMLWLACAPRVTAILQAMGR